MMLNNYPDAAAVRRDSMDAIAICWPRLQGRRSKGAQAFMPAVRWHLASGRQSQEKPPCH